MNLSEKDPQAIIESMETLSGHQSWKDLVEIITNNDLAGLKNDLLQKEYSSLEERNRDKDRLQFLKTLIKLPETLIPLLSRKPEEEVGDPYFHSISELRSGSLKSSS